MKIKSKKQRWIVCRHHDSLRFRAPTSPILGFHRHAPPTELQRGGASLLKLIVYSYVLWSSSSWRQEEHYWWLTSRWHQSNALKCSIKLIYSPLCLCPFSFFKPQRRNLPHCMFESTLREKVSVEVIRKLWIWIFCQDC